MAAPSILGALAESTARTLAGELIAGGSIRSAAIAAIPQAIRVGMSRRAFRDLLINEFGQAYRWQTMLGDWQHVAGLLRNEARIRALPPTADIPRSYYTEMELRRDRRYRIHGVATYYNEDTGEYSKRRVSMYDNINRGRVEWAAEYIRQNESAYPSDQGNLVEIEIINIEHNTGWDY